MPDIVSVQTVHARTLAAVRRQLEPGAIGVAWRPAIQCRLRATPSFGAADSRI